MRGSRARRSSSTRPSSPEFRSTDLFPACQPGREILRQPLRPDLRLRSLDVVGDAPEVRVLRVEIEQEIGRARIAVARLPHGTRVDEPAACCEVELAPALR